MRVLAAMSGGVDSAVAAARMVEAGHEVTGVHLALFRNRQLFRSGSRGCCSLEDSNDARRAADRLGIPFYVWDFSDRFVADVVDDFVSEYEAGRTPNPCLRCNEKIKFAAVLERGMALGFDAIATGHYASLVTGPDGVELHRAADPAKDQSYVLGVLTQAQLERSLFPLGGDLKSAVRVEAAERGLSVAQKPDSYDICFIADGDTAGFLESRLGVRPGHIVDEHGDTIGEHAGSHRFTIGQRKGLHLGHPAPDGRPRYVLDISPVTNTVTVGPREHLRVSEVQCIRPTWAAPARHGSWHGTVQVRAHGEPVGARIEIADTAEVVFDTPVTGVAPGQAAVFYDGTRVVASATIAVARPATVSA